MAHLNNRRPCCVFEDTCDEASLLEPGDVTDIYDTGTRFLTAKAVVSLESNGGMPPAVSQKMGDSIPSAGMIWRTMGLPGKYEIRHKGSNFVARVVGKTLRVDFKGIFRGISKATRA